MAPDKGETFAIGASTAKELKTLSKWRVYGKHVEDFILLGIMYTTNPQHEPHLRQEKVDKAVAKLRKLTLATKRGDFKRLIVRCDVMPIVTWGSAWMAPDNKQIKLLKSTIEKCICRGYRKMGRSPFVMWSSHLGCELDPEYVIHLGALRNEVRRAHKACEKEEAYTPPKCKSGPGCKSGLRQAVIHSTLELWKLTFHDNGFLQGPTSCVNLCYDGWHAIANFAKECWIHRIVELDKRTKGQLGPNQLPVLTAHRATLSTHNIDANVSRAALGSLPDARYLKKPQQARCKCGKRGENITRRHWYWQCPALESRRPTDRPTTELEEALGIPVTDSGHLRFAKWGEPYLQQQVTKAAQLLENYCRRKTKGHLVVATDGGAIGTSYVERRASWAIATTLEEDVAGPILSYDRTAAAAERWAAYFAARGIAEYLPVQGRVVTLVIDNLGVCRKMQYLQAKPPPSKWDCPALWWTVYRCLQLAPNLRIAWVPSHGKKPEWSPPQDLCVVKDEGKIWRNANENADTAATRVVQTQWHDATCLRARRNVAGVKAQKWLDWFAHLYDSEVVKDTLTPHTDKPGNAWLRHALPKLHPKKPAKTPRSERANFSTPLINSQP